MPAALDNFTTTPALLTQPAALQRDARREGIRPIHKWIFVLALVAFMIGLALLN